MSAAPAAEIVPRCPELCPDGRQTIMDAAQVSRHRTLVGVQQKKLIRIRQEKLTRPPLSTPSEKLAESLKVLAKLQRQHAGAIRASDLSRTHQERLLKQGFLLRVMNGWLIPSRPDNVEGESTAWYASYWRFCAVYLRNRFKTQWCLSPEQSLSIRAGSWTVPKQLVVRAPRARNRITNLPHGTSLFDLRALKAACFRPPTSSAQHDHLPRASLPKSTAYTPQE